MLGFAKSSGCLDKLSRSLVYILCLICSMYGIVATYELGALSKDPIATSIMSFGISMFLLSINPINEINP